MRRIGGVGCLLLLVCGVLAGCSGEPSTPGAPSTPPATATATGAARQPWTSGQLTITPDSLGAVTIGMTIKQASAAAGVRLVMVGDGVSDPRGGRPRGVSVFGDPVMCVATEKVPGGLVVRTPQGFPVGGTVGQLKAIYGASLRFLPRPAGGITPNVGYVVHYADGNLAFAAQTAGPVTVKTVIYLIIGGPGVVPSTECA